MSLIEELDTTFSGLCNYIGYYFINYPMHILNYFDLAFYMCTLFKYSHIRSFADEPISLYKLDGHVLQDVSGGSLRVENEKYLRRAGGVLMRNYDSGTNVESFMMIDQMSATEITNPIVNQMWSKDAINS